MRTALAIRTRVFVDEQGVPPDEEIDVHDFGDAEAVHALLRDAAGIPVGTGRYYALDAHAVQIGRMAIDVAARGHGGGAALLTALVAAARARGFTTVRLHAQMHARGFYLGAGFCDDGPPMWDAGIVHQPMRKALA